MNIAEGACYAPQGHVKPVVEPGEFNFAAAHLDHGHIYGQVNGLTEAGGTLVAVYDPDQARIAAFRESFPQAKAVNSLEDLLTDASIHLVAAAAIPDQRAAIGISVMAAGKDYFTDKSPFTTLGQLEEVRSVVAQTGRKYLVYYAERIHNEAAWHAGELVDSGCIGEVIQVVNLAPHRLSAETRPSWFFEKSRYGGIITDIGSHQVEQFLTYAGCSDARINFAAVRNQLHPEYPKLEDFGEFSLTGNNGASFYSRVDWHTPDGMPVWGDGRTFILGTEGSIEVRKYIDPAKRVPASSIFLADGKSLREIDCLGQVGFPFFGQLILDVLNRTEASMRQDHAFKAAELSMLAQSVADRRFRG